MAARSRSTILTVLAPILTSALLSAASCSGAHATTPDAKESSDAPDGAQPMADRSCADVKARLGRTFDGVFVIDPDRDGPLYKPFEVYCADMGTSTPKEYLELKHTSKQSDAPLTANYSAYAMGIPHGTWRCNCGVAERLYSKVRIDPIKLMLTPDLSFGIYSENTDRPCLGASTCPAPLPLGVAAACIDPVVPAGRGNVDLHDTPFHLAGVGDDVSMFKKFEDFQASAGFMSTGTAVIDADRKVVDLTGGGDCGGFGALAGLQLAQDL